MSEERAFWVLAALLEDILPSDYYSEDMVGGRVDQLVLQSCIAWKIPSVNAVLKESKTTLEPVAAPWFLCLFINTLPLYIVCRIWDCLFWEGNIVLFRIGLSLMKLKAEGILEAADPIAVYMLLKSGDPKHGTYLLDDGTVPSYDEGKSKSGTSKTHL